MRKRYHTGIENFVIAKRDLSRVSWSKRLKLNYFSFIAFVAMKSTSHVSADYSQIK